MNFKNINQIKDYCRQYNIKIVGKPSYEMQGFVGLHNGVAEVFCVPNYPKNTIYYDQNLKGVEKWRVIKHELEESIDMKNNGNNYWKAHCKAEENDSTFMGIKEK